QRLARDRLAASQQLGRLRSLFAQATSDYQQVTAAKARATALFDSLQAAQRAAILKAEAQARAKAVAAARAALAQARADAARAGAAAAASASAAKARTREKPATSTPTRRSSRPPAR